MNFSFNYFKNLEPMKYYEKVDSQLSQSLIEKRHKMLDNYNNEYIASQKWDGEWTMFIRGENELLVRSRSISKVTGEYGDKTQHVPHLTEEMMNWPIGTVILGELCFLELGKVSTDVGKILRCLPAEAVKRQKDNPLYVKVFDILSYDGKVLVDDSYSSRITIAKSMFDNNYCNYFSLTNFYYNNFQETADKIIENGGEGLVIQRLDNKYESGKRSAWHSLKLKQRLPIMTLKVINTIKAKKDYEGKYPEDWPYIIDGQPVTKPYFLGWKMGITVDYNGTKVDVSSGLDDSQREWLSSAEAYDLIKKGLLTADIKAMMEASLGGLRHPVVLALHINR